MESNRYSKVAHNSLTSDQLAILCAHSHDETAVYCVTEDRVLYVVYDETKIDINPKQEL